MEENKKVSNKKVVKARVFNIVQNEYNPKNGEDLHFNEENIKNCISHKTIKEWCYIRHDKDTYTKDDKERYGRAVGDLKTPHWHLVIRCKDAIELDAVAKWCGVPPQQVEIPKGRGAFMDEVQYLTHESEKQQNLGKHLYSDEEVHSNFNFREAINERNEQLLKYGRDLDRDEQIFFDVLYGGKTIREVIAEDKYIYMKHFQKIDSYRMKYIQQADPPTTRLNYFVTGQGGAGKDLISRALARSLYPQYESDDDIFFIVGAENSTFEGYDGQPVIIWSDFRAVDLVQCLGGRGNVFRVFDTHPTKQRQNVKYSSINLINTVNIVNSVQSYIDFLNGLAGEYVDKHGNFYKSEDKKQSFRRFPFIIPLYEEDFSLLINKGFMYNDGNFLEYEEYSRIRGNMQKIAELCGNNERLLREIEMKTMKQVTDKHNEIMEQQNIAGTDEEILNELEFYGRRSPNLNLDKDLPF